MPRARSMMNQHVLDIVGFPEDMPEVEKLAHDLSSYDDDEPTVKVQVPAIMPLVDLSDVEDDDEVTEVMPIMATPAKYPGYGLIMALLLGTAMWFLPCYLFLTWLFK